MFRNKTLSDRVVFSPARLALRVARDVSCATAPQRATASSVTCERESVGVSPASLGGAVISACKATGTTARTAARVCLSGSTAHWPCRCLFFT